MIWLIAYLTGAAVTYWLAVRHWFRRFGPEWGGLAWAVIGAVTWPLTVWWFLWDELDARVGGLEVPRWIARAGGVREENR